MGHGAERSEVLGRGWFAQAPILWAGKGLAMPYCDSALAKRPFDPVRQEQLVTFGALLAEPLALARERAFDRRHRGLTPSLRVVLELLDADPELDTSTLARRAGLPPRALGQLCAQQLGQSLVQTRNEHRLARFFRELEAGRQAGKPTPLLELALRSGFGSYAQFHRVFTCTLGAPPKVYLQEPTAPAVPRASSVKSEK